MSRSSKDLAKRLPFRHFPRGDLFHRWYPWLALAGTAAALLLWLLLGRAVGPRQYMPRPVSSAHATFSDRCENCHDSFQAVQDARCLACHTTRVHSQHETHTPPCRGCHVEHLQADRLTRVASGLCTDCHAALESRRPGGPRIAARIGSFADHPEFSPLKEGATDPTRLRFNHRTHLTSNEIREPLQCANCHQPEADGRYMTTTGFERYASRLGEEAAVWPAAPENEGEAGAGDRGGVQLIYCRKCHAQSVKEVPSPFNEIEVPHAQPAAIRGALVRDVAALGVERARTIFEADTVRLPGRVPRVPVDVESRSWAEFQERWVAAIERELYRHLREVPSGASLFEANRYCFLCHDRGDATQDDLPSIAPPAIPARWLPRAEFSHRPHAKLDCADCHGDLKESRDTTEVNLPGKELCQKCHRPEAARSAGTQCVLCHSYHDTIADPAGRHPLQKNIPLDTLTGATVLAE